MSYRNGESSNSLGWVRRFGDLLVYFSWLGGRLGVEPWSVARPRVGEGLAQGECLALHVAAVGTDHDLEVTGFADVV